jgi:hypothetical protein
VALKTVGDADGLLGSRIRGCGIRRSANAGLYLLVTRGLRGDVLVAWIAGDRFGEAFRVS